MLMGERLTSVTDVKGFGHYAVQCPTKEASKDLLTVSANNTKESGEYEEIYEPDFTASDGELERRWRER